MSAAVPIELRELVRQRSKARCEYCLLHEDDSFFSHEVDHIVAVKHGGQTIEDNLAWSCAICNRRKGSDLTSIDPESGEIVRLFHPRHDVWQDHFQLEHGRIIPLTPIGRVTVFLLKFNRSKRVRIRRALMAAGQYPRS